MKKLLILSAAVAAGLTSCSSEETLNTLSNERAISFSTYVGTNTKGAQVDNANLTSFGVYGLHHVATDEKVAVWAEGNMPNYMNNQKVTKKTVGYTTSWVYSPIKYWPNNLKDRVSFFAYAPYSKAGIEFTSTGRPRIQFALSANSQDMIDLVAAAPQYNLGGKSPNNNDVQFNLRHLLTRVRFSAKVAGDIVDKVEANGITRVIIEELQLVGTDNVNLLDKNNEVQKSTQLIASAQFTFADEADAAMAIAPATDAFGLTDKSVMNVGNWLKAKLQKENYGLSGVKSGDNYPGIFDKKVHDAKIGTCQDYFFLHSTREADGKDARYAVSLFKDNQYLFMIPPVDEAVTGIEMAGDVRVYIKYRIVTEDNALSDKFHEGVYQDIMSLPEGGMQAGKAYNYTITINMDEVKLSATLEDWKEENVDLETPDPIIP